MLRKVYGNPRPEQYLDAMVGSQARTGLCCRKQTEFMGPLVVAILSPCTVSVTLNKWELNFQWLLSCLLHREKGYLLPT